jgi:hypothetical protein
MSPMTPQRCRLTRPTGPHSCAGKGLPKRATVLLAVGGMSAPQQPPSLELGQSDANPLRL